MWWHKNLGPGGLDPQEAAKYVLLALIAYVAIWALEVVLLLGADSVQRFLDPTLHWKP